ncbi:hypothetical protein ACOMHN_003651 [Nucella lapillus]
MLISDGRGFHSRSAHKHFTPHPGIAPTRHEGRGDWCGERGLKGCSPSMRRSTLTATPEIRPRLRGKPRISRDSIGLRMPSLDSAHWPEAALSFLPSPAHLLSPDTA